MRIVIDTNVILSGKFWRGAPHILMEQAGIGAVTLILSPDVLAEIADVISRPKFQAMLTGVGRHQDKLIADLRGMAEIIDPPPLVTPVCRDQADDKFLVLAWAAQADVIVSGDRDLLSLGQFRDIRIVTPADALALLA